MTTTTIARAWRINRSDGTTLGFTDHDGPLEFDGVVFRPDSGLSARALVQAVGLSVDNTEAEGALSDEAITETDLIAGRWDGAELSMWEVDWSDPSQRRLAFRGHIGEVSRRGGGFRAELRGLSEALNKSMGRAYHPRCSARLGDRWCKVDLEQAQLRVEASIVAIDDDRTFRIDTLVGYRARWFDHGSMSVLSGACSGVTAPIKNDRLLSVGRRQIELWAAASAPMAVGDRVSLTAGCDKSGACCRDKFDNYLNFRGFPHMPGEDWLVAPQVEKRRKDVAVVAQFQPYSGRSGDDS
ncbi:DUF2163 domain-containing protein [Paracoccus sp. TK19116]|uniref:DUF2163 domain-containing protein n=1 Tax=Paracoccus albicereus TaxID=2922394 RepID=A0ABT1MU69_9RHOB|nr:DUF2163 domain-containing protein [Paracoccus albicereus]MCQ0971878.1 DUF2163 domain-containing protein [Paracoccus albicereus]